ncbi:hypothetical protein D5S17_26320 [Pseudonocardiaceae bacterium YIM PH 21723]|nr:hypothetical protein D5S17_26320 [Pseudonocardiaceae bacterium YIM PH 21723]
MIRRFVSALSALVLAAGLTVAVASPASAAACSPAGSGVTVIVDFTGTGGSPSTQCASGDPASGLAALTGAGFTYGFPPSFPGFVCKINNQPTCTNPNGSAYWSYWHGTPGGSWTYSSSGAGSYNPAPGSVEGWSFGAGTAPTVGP